MFLVYKNAIICGTGGSNGSAIARGGAKVFLAGRTFAELDAAKWSEVPVF